jgi:polysaccharide pyruvyl transferase WcaK-like protein
VKQIVILDTWVNASNLGNRIIREAVEREVGRLFPGDFVFAAPAHERIRGGRPLVERADHVFLGGANLLSADMNRTSEWHVGLRDTRWLKGVVLLGVGWWQYQDRRPNRYTRLLLRRVLDGEALHSVRDSYTAARLSALGFDCVNTGCPSIWGLTEERAASIPERKASTALVTFTEYNQDRIADARLLETVRARYQRVKLWPQMYGDYAYAKELGGEALEILDPSVEALDACLGGEAVDYVGTRLHAGIRALQHGRRTLIVAVDNRAAEMGRDFGLPIVMRADIDGSLAERIDGVGRPAIRIDTGAIARWQAQFQPSR